MSGFAEKIKKEKDGAFLEDKIAAIGLKLRKWVSFHGISINIDPNLEHFSGIIPCGEADFGVTSINELGVSVTMDDFDRALKNNFLDFANNLACGNYEHCELLII